LAALSPKRAVLRSQSGGKTRFVGYDKAALAHLRDVQERYESAEQLIPGDRTGMVTAREMSTIPMRFSL
jgi:hypothetical protein